MKKAQIQLTETIAVLFIFFVLVLFGLIFYSKYQEGALIAKDNELFEKRVIEATTKVLFFPELACTDGKAEVEDFCFDVFKLDHIETYLEENRDYYFQIFGFAKIDIVQIYPEIDAELQEGEEPEGKWIIYDVPKQTDEEGGRPEVKATQFVVSLQKGKNSSLGLVTVGGYK